jgi:hypothetical protein
MPQAEVAMTWRQQNSKRAEGALPTVTEAAAAQVLDILQSRNIPEDVAVRVNLVDQGPRVRSWSEANGRHDVRLSSRVILLLDARTALSMPGYTFDSRRTPESPQFVLRSPEEL